MTIQQRINERGRGLEKPGEVVAREVPPLEEVGDCIARRGCPLRLECAGVGQWLDQAENQDAIDVWPHNCTVRAARRFFVIARDHEGSSEREFHDDVLWFDAFCGPSVSEGKFKWMTCRPEVGEPRHKRCSNRRAILRFRVSCVFACRA